MSEVDGQRNAGQAGGGGRSATSADGNFVFDVNAQGRDLAILGFENLAIGGDDEVILHAAADVRVAAFGGYEEVRSTLGAQAEMEIESQSGSVKGRTQVGRSRRERQAEGTILGCGTRRHRLKSSSQLSVFSSQKPRAPMTMESAEFLLTAENMI
jgi:hypothetical protein